MKLNIYEKKKIIKTYEAESYDLPFGVVEDVMNAVKIDEIKSGKDVEIIKSVFGLMSNSMDTVKKLMLDIFDGLTEEELRKATATEIAEVIVEIVIDSFNRIVKPTKTPKN